jgi:hypothetical protein
MTIQALTDYIDHHWAWNDATYPLLKTFTKQENQIQFKRQHILHYLQKQVVKLLLNRLALMKATGLDEASPVGWIQELYESKK